jgi:DNA-binding MarR family transcriptional regulator
VSLDGAGSRNDSVSCSQRPTQRWNELLAERFAAMATATCVPSYGSVLLPLYEEDGLRMGELAARARLSKQTMTQMIARLERDGLVKRAPTRPTGGRRWSILTERARRFEPVAAAVLQSSTAS